MSFTDDLRGAMSTTVPLDYIEGVKHVVANQLAELDSTAEIKNTRYFNHSAIPDFVLTWPGERGERRVYLRDSYESIVAARDSHYLTTGDPVIVSLEEASEDAVEAITEAEVELDGRALLTDAAAFEVLEEQSASSGPLNRMIRANFVRGARGHVDRPVVESLIRVPGATEEDNERSASRDAVITASFLEDAAARIRRTAALIDAAMAGQSGNEREFASNADMSGQLSLSELQNILPWLLDQPSARANHSFWSRVGGMMTFADLEKLRDHLGGVDLDPLIHANADRWEARWVYMGISLPDEGAEDYDERSEHWSFQRGGLGIDLGDRRLFIARNGQLLTKGRPGRSSSTWESIEPSLVGARVSQVDLRGVRRSVTLTAEESPDIRADVQEVSESLEDTYYVSGLTLQVAADAEFDKDSEITADFGKGLLSSSGSPIRSLVEYAIALLRPQREPSPEEDLHLFGTATT